MESTYSIKKAEIYKILMFLLIFMVLGYFFGSLLHIDLPINRENISMTRIFLNNITIGIVLILFTSLVSYPIILFNGFFLGLNILFAIQLFGLDKTFLTLIFHTPLEIFGWIICIIASKRMFTFYRDLLKKQFNLKLLLTVSKFVGALVLIYLLAAIIEYNVFKLLGGSKWLS